EGRLPPRLIRPDDVGEEVRGAGTNTRYVRNVLPASAAAERLLVVEVLTPGGHWSSYPPHKHDSDHGGETQLEETYYHRLARPGGFAFQRVYTDDRTLDETMTVEDRDVVLVPRGYHPVSAAHGFDLYYLNVMAAPVRRWQFTTAPGYEFLCPRPSAVFRRPEDGWHGSPRLGPHWSNARPEPGAAPARQTRDGVRRARRGRARNGDRGGRGP